MCQKTVSQPQPRQAIVIKPGQRKRRRSYKRPSATSDQWRPHHGDAALDAWGTALRSLKAQGLSWE
jgi:hypothetical protein